MVVMPLIIESHPDEDSEPEQSFYAGGTYHIDLPNHEEYFTPKVFSPNVKEFLNDNRYLARTRDIQELKTFHTIITYSWDGNEYGPCSSWYDAFELWYMIKFNIPLEDFGGKKIALLFPDSPTKESRETILLSIFNKYHLSKQNYARLMSSIFFIDNPTSLDLPDTDLVLVDGKIPKNIDINVKDLYLQLISSLKEESLKQCTYQKLKIYYDPRINQLIDHYKQTQNIEIRKLQIARNNEPNTFIYEDVIRRINFGIFKSNTQARQKSGQARFLLYITPKNRGQVTYTPNELDDILNTLPDTVVGKIGLQVRKNQRELWSYFRKDTPQTGKSPKTRNLTPEEIQAVVEKGTIFGNGYNEADVIEQEPKAKFIIVGLTEANREFESMLIARALTRGIFIATETITYKELPVLDIHTKYDYYIFTPAKDWTTSRFIPEAIYHKKKVLYTDNAEKQLKVNIPLAIRINDSENYITYLAEDDIYLKPKSLIAKALIQ